MTYTIAERVVYEGRVTHAWATLCYNNEVVKTIHISEALQYGAGYTFICADGHEMYARCLAPWCRRAPHFVHKHTNDNCCSTVAPTLTDSESTLHNITKTMIANHFALDVEFNYVESSPFKTGNFRSDAGREGFYYEVSWKNKLKSNSKKWNYLQDIVNKGAEVYEVQLFKMRDKTTGLILWEEYIQDLLADPKLLMDTITAHTKKIDKAEDIEHQDTDKGFVICRTKCTDPKLTEISRCCQNCKNFFTNDKFRQTYHKCFISGIKRNNPDVSPFDCCQKFERK